MKKNNVDISHMYRKEGITANNQIINDENGERFGVENAWQDGVYYDFLLSENDWDYVSDFEVWSTHTTNILKYLIECYYSAICIRQRYFTEGPGRPESPVDSAESKSLQY